MARKLDRTSSLILSATAKTPMTPGQIARFYRIPVVECWRRVRELQETGLLRLIMVNATADGRTLRFFQSTIASEHLVDVPLTR